MLIETLSVFPQCYDSIMNESIMKRAQDKGILEFRAHDLRDWTHDKHRTTDDEPYGGGQGLVMKCEPSVRRTLRRCSHQALYDLPFSHGRDVERCAHARAC